MKARKLKTVLKHRLQLSVEFDTKIPVDRLVVVLVFHTSDFAPIFLALNLGRCSDCVR